MKQFAPLRRPLGDVQGRKTERLSEYFDFDRFPEKADLKVRRNELLAILEQLEKGKAHMAWWRRLWRALKRPVGSGPLPATPATKGEIERGEATPG